MIYLDNCATTKVDDAVLKEFNKYSVELYFNPSSLTNCSGEVVKSINKTRHIIADTLKCESSNIFFTSGGTEADNLAIFGSIRQKTGKYIASLGEHAAVNNSFFELKSKGYEVEFLKLNNDGSLDFKDLVEKMDETTRLVSVMHVNNETGVINDIETIGKYVKSINPKCIFMVDGVQGFCKQNIDVKKANIDYYAMSGHKIHAPKGIGALYIKNGLSTNPIIYGGGQESHIRSGTENVAGIMSFGKAVELARENLKVNNEKFQQFRLQIINELDKNNIEYKLLCPNNYSVNILSLAIKNIKAEVLMRLLESEGIIVGIGSACSSKEGRDRVMRAIGLDNNYINGVIRICFSKFINKEDIDMFCKIFNERIIALTKTIKGNL